MITGESKEHVVLDMEAGMEHFSRGTTRNSDTLLIVAEPYYKSLETAARISQLSSELGIARTFVVANKVRSSDEENMRKFADSRGMTILLQVPYDETVAEADRLGIAPMDYDGSAAVVVEVDSLAERLLSA